MKSDLILTYLRNYKDGDEEEIEGFAKILMLYVDNKSLYDIFSNSLREMPPIEPGDDFNEL
eukprot:CAMPEP_0170498684 /NCGR_PEP_ID=MMETSP0208-20121228/28594_1 /TAXON_ID=197538 /ORGANISM="Strombidium inclinatum, Strain S3" /LENGTH=60 /DNA_ID=CAMNT_0010775937 /DNA_START=398 /DNA_END=580 /DNA_ORIENTATION=+